MHVQCCIARLSNATTNCELHASTLTPACVASTQQRYPCIFVDGFGSPWQCRMLLRRHPMHTSWFMHICIFNASFIPCLSLFVLLSRAHTHRQTPCLPCARTLAATAAPRPACFNSKSKPCLACPRTSSGWSCAAQSVSQSVRQWAAPLTPSLSNLGAEGVSGTAPLSYRTMLSLFS